MREISITQTEARSLALCAQGIPSEVGEGEFQLSDLVYRLGALQLDFVSRVAASQYLVVASRRSRSCLEDVRSQLSLYEDVVEGEFHAASLISRGDFIDFWPYLSQRRGVLRRSHRKALGDDSWRLLERVESAFQESTVLTAGEIEDIVPNVSPDGWWGRKTGRIALDALHFQGRLAIHHRDEKGRPHYCLPSHIRLPEEFQFNDSEVADSLDKMILRSIESLGCGSVAHIHDFYRLPKNDVSASISRLIESGLICRVQVKFDSAPWYSTPEAMDNLGVGMEKVSSFPSIALSPFDSLIWHRSRTKVLFDFDYVNTMYYPKEKRERLGLGYYVLPVLAQSGFVGRVDVARDGERLVPIQVWLEDERVSSESLRDALTSLATWLGCDLHNFSSAPVRIFSTT